MPAIARSYSELRRLPTFVERFRYLVLGGRVGQETFGFDRWMNQEFYRSVEWRHIRHVVIARDDGCDLGVRGHEIHDRIYIHHLRPLTVENIVDGDEDMLNPEYL